MFYSHHRQASDPKSRLLAQIADELDVPVTEFYEPHLLRDTAEPSREDASVVYALLQAFLAIEGAEARGRVLAFARSLTRESCAHGAVQGTSRPSLTRRGS